MSSTAWTWAQLSDDQLKRIAQAEQSLGADYLLAYQPAGTAAGVNMPQQGLRLAALSTSQLECLLGLESQLNTVLVAYSA